MKKWYYIIFIAVILAVIAIVLYIRNTKSTIDKSETDFSIDDTASINKIRIIKGSDSLIIERFDNYWRVNGLYAAREIAISEFLMCLKLIKLKSPVPDNAREYVINKLQKASLVEIYKNDRILKSFYIGSQTTDKSGNYIMLTEAENPYIAYIPSLVQDLSQRFTTDLLYWRSKEVFKYNIGEINEICIDYLKAPVNSFCIKIDVENQFHLIDYQENEIADFNIDIVSRYLSYFKNVEFEDFFEDIDTIAENKPEIRVQVTDKEGNVNLLDVYPRFVDGEKDADYFYGKINNSDYVLVKYYSFDLIFKEIRYFIL